MDPIRSFNYGSKKGSTSSPSDDDDSLAAAHRRHKLEERAKDFKIPLPGGETTFERVFSALTHTKPSFKRLPGYDPNVDEAEYYRAQQSLDCDEVYPRIYVGDGMTARNKAYLQRIGITHVLNAAEGRKYGQVNTSKAYYKDTNIKYLGLPMQDVPSESIEQYFDEAAAFIERAVSNYDGRVYVHCVQGISRSATCVIAYLMIKKAMLATDAIRTVRLSRDVCPNDGFLRKLVTLDNNLRRQRLKDTLAANRAVAKVH